ncbi:transposase [Candidatus Roizmanbacteria bacterium CG02_land_8_20_14_3_00_36_15]|uniref:Transposase n=2 Tax=Candidatus Roizmaniibacteriota TaxID=1752723 RepID=A0A2M8KLY1_9BACT|nr:MAG: transposase [Candidatus Roizmanbacteria bacterium CG02_land_8_20_14_3_00_36_15]PIY70198.1 MAG: transposase [Candidatus Roizmanbacteria bacterium CG_4_10_14_0_8_um_filter_36_36]PJA53409.1 MAG: transposase [Candidatus Roizmanbacteria bacterium CG_4_9_14_3_um_filter_36_11]PJC81354.1 MAG: transposase [Candidatus Roizmanbacteria bacterium CG_4_8_14_3_um_filter_36_10]PJE60919.1 MAG: transposase [Candidatus Roizmanbacteria bacterium CG10_big_fil_rev_8_21_14_0_10_36_26]
MDNIIKKPTRKGYPSRVKFQAVMEVIKGKPVGEVARLYGFHPTLFPRWKKQFEEKGPGIFEDRKTDESQKKIEELTRMIGKKEIEIECSEARF